MTGTPSEPTKEEHHDDLADGGESNPSTTSETPSEEAHNTNDTPKKTKKKRKGSGPPSRPKPIARIIAILVFVGIPAALLLFSGKERGGKGGGLPASTRWAAGSEQEVNITLVAQDKTLLSCSSPAEVAGLHCEYEAKDKKWSKGGPDEKSLLKPYRLAGTNDPVLVAGLWNSPALQGALPPQRFIAKCKIKVEGKLGKLAVRWNPKDSWFDEPFDWPVASVSNCTITK
jgi:hypothetical protein